MSEAKNCGNCQHWRKGKGSVADPPEGKGMCGLISDSEYDSKAIALTAFGYDLFTSAVFGCVLHEPGKEKP